MVTTTKHTPGPWKLRDHPLMPGAPVEVVDARGLAVVHLCAAGEKTYDGDTTAANAALIAAAPDLLVAAAELLADLDARSLYRRRPGLEDAADTLRAAVAKARGGS
jgi:hypothetical protein